MEGFLPVPGHVGFLAKRVFDRAGAVLDVSIAHLASHGGGPEPAHCHPDRDHLFIALEGVLEVRTPEDIQRFGPNEACLVKGETLHEIWNTGGPAVVVGVTLAAAQA